MSLKKKQKVLILHFPNLNNYGTGMMGLITIQSIADRYGFNNVEFYCDFNNFADFSEIRSELRGDVLLNAYINEDLKAISNTKNKTLRKIKTILHLLFNVPGRGFTKIIVLGGDDLSEYYSPNGAAFELYKYWKSSFVSKVILLGQTIGPFSNKLNRFAVKFFLPRLNVHARDPWSVGYMQKEFGLDINKMADIALDDLPLQSDPNIEAEILNRFNLRKNKYFTIVISGLQNKNFYCTDSQIYLKRFCEIIERLLNMPQLKNKKVCLLAHTFPPYPDESSYLIKLGTIIPEELKQQLILITDRILETRARFILGNGLFTITGRMHAAVSTFQMGKPAICLSYSTKFKGVIGDSIGRYDLVIESNDSKIWMDGTITMLIEKKVEYVLTNYADLCNQVIERIKPLKQLVRTTFTEF